jgi:hypothetical protein
MRTKPGRPLSAISSTAMLATLFFASAQPASAVDVFLNPQPQAYNNTCQSYGLALALAMAGDGAYAVQNTGELRAAEEYLRGLIETIAKQKSLTPLHHTVWEDAVAAATNSRYSLVIEEIASVDAFNSRVAALTGNGAVEVTGSLLAAIMTRQAVLTSVKSVDSNRYGSGHIVTLFGVGGGPPNSSQRPLAMLNSAVKTPRGDLNACNLKDKPGDLKYSAEVALKTRYELNPFGGKYRLMWLKRK